MTRRKYSNLLAKIADEGPDAFYAGRAAEHLIAAVQEANGTMTLKDLEGYRIAFRPPLAIQYRDYKITSCGTPSN